MFVYNALNQQIFAKLGDGSFPHGKATTFIEKLSLYSLVGCAILLCTTPTSFSGTAAKFISNVNFWNTILVIVVGVVKGVEVSSNIKADEDTREFTAINLGGFLQVTILLAGSICGCQCMPQLNYEIAPQHRQRAACVVPAFVVTLQCIVFLAIGIAGYMALGNAVQGDVFKVYALQDADRVLRAEQNGHAVSPDWKIIILQGGIAMLMYFSAPLLQLPAKAQLWRLFAHQLGFDGEVGLNEAPTTVKHALNFLLVCFTTAVPLFLGDDAYMALLTVLAGTAANWMNLFLPGFVILFTRVLPARQERSPWIGSALLSGWLFTIGLASAVSSTFKIASLFRGDSQPVHHHP
jgi:hypothetical protein